MRHGAVTEVDAVVVEQSVLARNLEVIGGSQDLATTTPFHWCNRYLCMAGVLVLHR